MTRLGNALLAATLAASLAKDQGACGAHKSESACSAGAGCTWWGQYGCYASEEGSKGGKKTTSCNSTHMGDSMDMPRSCIATAGGPRCWWTYVPTAVENGAATVPLLVDMHGGGGCASHAVQHGFKALADEEGFIVAYPQGKGGLWSSSGADSAALNAADPQGKQVSTQDDVGFLSQLVANLAASSSDGKGKVDVTRVYFTGFSMGCMMSNRIAMERSNLVAGFGCQGGGLNWESYGALQRTLEGEKARFNIQSMPSITTIGSDDVWLSTEDHKAWSAWNGCSGSGSAVAVTLAALGDRPTSAELSVAPGCQDGVETQLLKIDGMGHITDPRMPRKIWDFLKQYSRAGAPAALPVYSTAIGTDTDACTAHDAAPACNMADSCQWWGQYGCWASTWLSVQQSSEKGKDEDQKSNTCGAHKSEQGCESVNGCKWWGQYGCWADDSAEGKGKGKDSALGTGAIAGIVAGSVCVVVGASVWMRHRSRADAQRLQGKSGMPKLKVAVDPVAGAAAAKDDSTSAVTVGAASRVL